MANQKKSTFQRLINGRLNRKQRRELGRKLSAEDPGREIVNRNVAGIDVGIGIGAAVTRRPLPHHRAYGSVHGGSIGYASPPRPMMEDRAT